MFGINSDSLNDDSNNERLDLWRYSLSHFIYRPFFGYGCGNFTYYVQKIWVRTTVVVAHNTYIDFLIDSGLIGFSLYMMLFFRNVKPVFTKKGIMILPLFLCFLFTSFIVGGERTYFVWNDLFVISVLCANIDKLKNETIE